MPDPRGAGARACPGGRWLLVVYLVGLVLASSVPLAQVMARHGTPGPTSASQAA